MFKKYALAVCLVLVCVLSFAACGENSDNTKTLSDLEITTQPSKTVYIAGDLFNPLGMVVTAKYSDGSSGAVAGYTISKTTALATSDTAITVSYTENGVVKTAEVIITVNSATEKALTKIEITTPPTKTTYTAGETFSIAGMVVTARYSDDSSTTVTSYEISKTTALSTSDKSITVSYTENGVVKTAEVTITVSKATEKALTDIEITSPPTKTTYTAGETFSIAGMVVTARYSDGSFETVTDYIYKTDALTVNDTKIIISYTNDSITKTVAVDITVNPSETTNAEAPNIIGQPMGVTISIGTTYGLNVIADVKDSGVLSYQWFSNTVNSTIGGEAIDGATSATYAAPINTVGTIYYYAIVTNTNDSVNGTKTAIATSEIAMLTVNALVNAQMPNINTQPQSLTNVIKNASNVTLTVAASVADGGLLTYQWYSNNIATNIGGNIISGETGPSINVPTNISGEFFYYCTITNTINDNGDGGQKTAGGKSNAVTVTVIEDGHVIISAEDFTFEGNSAFTKVPSATTTFSFIGLVTVSAGATWQVSSDISGQNTILSKTISLNIGDNVVYILVTSQSGSGMTLYTFTIRRSPTYTVIFNTDGGTTVNSQTVEEGNFVTNPGLTATSKTGYTFSAWDFDFGLSITDTVAINAQWTANTYSVKYDENKPSTASGDIIGSINNSSHAYDVANQLTANSYSLIGWTFTGWNSQADGNGTSYADGQSVSNLSAAQGAVVTLFAQWSAQAYNIIYRDIGGTAFSGIYGAYNPFEHIFDSVTYLVDPSKAGFAFDGWFISQNGSGTSLTSLSATAYSSDITLYAKWSVSYLDQNGEEQRISLDDMTILSTAGDQTLSGWYILQGNINLYPYPTFTVLGEAHLILANHCDWVNIGAIEVTVGNTLYIYSQSTGINQGKISVRWHIGGSSSGGLDSGTIIINGGIITAAGIGGNGGAITINGGTITATNIGGGNGSTGNGGAGGNGGAITINGGAITATNIGGGNGGNGRNGVVSLVSGNTYSASSAVAGGNGGAGGVITISGGTVTATNIGGGDGGYGGAGASHTNGINNIYWGTRHGAAGGNGGECGVIVISGGTITARNIGGGYGGEGGRGGLGDNLDWNGGNGGDGGRGGNITISGGYINGWGLVGGGYRTVNIGGGAAGIGGVRTLGGIKGADGTDGTDGNISISGGSINTNIQGSPTNGATNGNANVYLVVIELTQPAAINAAVESWTILNAVYYNFEYVKTDENGKLYLWLPLSAIVTSITIGGVIYPVN